MLASRRILDFCLRQKPNMLAHPFRVSSTTLTFCFSQKEETLAQYNDPTQNILHIQVAHALRPTGIFEVGAPPVLKVSHPQPPTQHLKVLKGQG
jgi:hypothetical protein